MALRVRRVKKSFGFDKTKTEKYVLVPDRATVVKFGPLCDQIAAVSGINLGMVQSVVYGLLKSMTTFIRQGHSSTSYCGLEELKVSESDWKEKSLEDKIEHVRVIDFRVDEIQKQTGLSKGAIFQTYFPEIETIRTKQQRWDGETVNGVKYTMQPFVSSTGKVYRGVFPEFPAKCEIRLPEYCMSDAFWSEYGNKSDRMQMKYATIGLKEELVKDISLKSALNLNDQQYADIMTEKDKIEGLTWHHDINFGRMKLIDEKVHSFKEHQHSGGMATWNDRWVQSHLIDISKMENVKKTYGCRQACLWKTHFDLT